MESLTLSSNEKKILLHSCCAICAGGIMEFIIENGLELTVFFYNPNIHPRLEYEHRKEENIRFARKHHIPFVDADYEERLWFNLTMGLEDEPERGRRCTVCFDMRLEKTAAYAAAHDFKVFATTLGISRWKDLNQVNACGYHAAEKFPGVRFLEYNWRIKGGIQRMSEVARKENFYRQRYCGCFYSLRDRRRQTEKKPIPKVQCNQTQHY